MRRGLLLINLGTPDSASNKAVRKYLREFLSDRRVIDLPALIRFFLVRGIILPFRTKKSAQAYQKIWTPQGSPLLFNSQNLAQQLQTQLGESVQIALGMRYGSPSIASALEQLKHCSTLTVLPLYPQYSSAATGSAIEEAMCLIAKQEVTPHLHIIREFYQHPAFIKAQAQVIREHLRDDEHLIFSYHGLPERQIRKSGCVQVCAEHCPPITSANEGCYRAQCFETSLLLAKELHLNPSQYSSAFQSRLGKTPWIKPYTDELLIKLAQQGIKKIAIVCPSFVSDCLETLEEITIRAKNQWQDLQGDELNAIPCLNSHPAWINALEEIIEK